MKKFSLVVLYAVLLFGAVTDAQNSPPVPARDPADFGTKFFDDLRTLFGKLQRDDLDRAFRRGQAIHCSDLVQRGGEWKQVAFLNDDRTLGDWHFDNIQQVKTDPVRFVFSGVCIGSTGPVKIETSYPVTESFKRYQEGRIPFSDVTIRKNNPVSAVFESSSESYTFRLPYLYIESKDSHGVIYTLDPPENASIPERSVAEEFRCKALNDADLTYRFMLCRTHVVDRDPVVQRRMEKEQPLGNAAYYILSDGKEAGTSVRLTFEHDPGVPPEPVPAPPRPERPDVPVPAVRDWKSAPGQSKLSDIGQGEFRLRFTDPSWNGRIDKPQVLAGGRIAERAAGEPARLSGDYCQWEPGPANQANRLTGRAIDSEILFALSFRKDATLSATFDLDAPAGAHYGTLQCNFRQAQSPADITVERWLGIVGNNVAIDVRAP